MGLKGNCTYKLQRRTAIVLGIFPLNRLDAVGEDKQMGRVAQAEAGQMVLKALGRISFDSRGELDNREER